MAGLNNSSEYRQCSVHTATAKHNHQTKSIHRVSHTKFMCKPSNSKILSPSIIHITHTAYMFKQSKELKIVQEQMVASLSKQNQQNDQVALSSLLHSDTIALIAQGFSVWYGGVPTGVESSISSRVSRQPEIFSLHSYPEGISLFRLSILTLPFSCRETLPLKQTWELLEIHVQTF